MTVKTVVLLACALAAFEVSPALAQTCDPTASPTPEQIARRREALRATRTVNNLQANQPGAAKRTYLRHTELASSPFAQRSGRDAEYIKTLNLTPGEDLLPGWQLTLDVTTEGYWFMIKDKSDPCGFAYISNQNGLIFEAQPIR